MKIKELEQQNKELSIKLQTKDKLISSLQKQLASERVTMKAKLFRTKRVNKRNLNKKRRYHQTNIKLELRGKKLTQKAAIVQTAMTKTIQRVESEKADWQERCIRLEEELEEMEKQLHEEMESLSPQIKTKEGRRFTNEIHALYYQLLSLRLSPNVIHACIKTVVRSFCPHMDTDVLQLPKSRLAAHMRSSELPTVSKAHQATVLSESDEYQLFSDGTTLNQRKVEAVIINDLVLGVEGVASGSAKASLDELELTLNKIKTIGREIGIPNTDKIGFRRIKSTMSDSASTQKALNKMIVEKARSEFSEDGGDPEIVHGYFGMHLGVNLRAAAIKGIDSYKVSNHLTTESGVDNVVHATCKLLGHVGTSPEYGLGVVAFPEFIKSKLDSDATEKEYMYLKQAENTKFDRQVGSRYFVTAHNAARIFFLAPLVINFLEELQTMKSLNGLEKEVLRALKSDELAELKVDGLLSDKIYSDLMTLLKSKQSFKFLPRHERTLL